MTSTVSPPPISETLPRSEEHIAARVKALESILVENGILSTDVVDRLAEMYETQVGPHLGAKVVARAWTDPEFKQRLLANTSEACKEMGVSGMQGEDMVAIENTDDVHNMIVCTLCSCYPWPVLGLPPNWYKYPAYRSRAVREPRVVLAEFGLVIPESTEIRVWDSSAELRYWVLPQRPADTEDMSEDELAQLVTRNSMIGVGLPSTPAAQ